MDSPDPISFDWAMERIDRAESQIWEMVQQVLKRGLPVILDLGFTKASHRQKFYDFTKAAGAEVSLRWVDVSPKERWRRVQSRNTQKGKTFAMEVSREMFDFMENEWEAPIDAEIPNYKASRH